MTSDILLSVRRLSVTYQTRTGPLRALENMDYDLRDHAVTAVIGESGCGKSTLAAAILGVLPANAAVDPAASIRMGGQDLLKLPANELRQFRWQRASMVFQSAANALNPTLPIGTQLLDCVWDHAGAPVRDVARSRARELLTMVKLDPERIMPQYPHQLSGGMRQRVALAMALMLSPELVVLDEPTTALDVITQHYLFAILADLQQQRNLALLLVTHDLGAAATLADHLVVMYGGQVVETGGAEEVFTAPAHPYTAALLNAVPRLDGVSGTAPLPVGIPPPIDYQAAGCRYAARCPRAAEQCRRERPALRSWVNGQAACFFPGEVGK